MTLIRSFAAVGIACVILSGCGGSTTQTGRQSLLVNVATPPRNLDVTTALAVTDTLAANFYVRLVDERNGKIEPWLAKSWTVSPDGRTYRFTLKPGLTFASGAATDANAVKTTIESDLKTPVASYFISDGQIGNVTSVQAPNPTTVVIKLKHADASYLSALAAPPAVIVDPSVIVKRRKALATTEAGSGPFQLVSYTPGTRLVLKPRPSYARWSGQTDPAKQVTVNFVTSDTTMLLDAQSGSVDLTYGLSKRSLKSLEGNGKVTLNKAPAGSLQELMLSWYSPPFDKPAVREAVTLAIPYQQLLSTAAVGYGRLFYGPLIPGMEFFDPNTAAPVKPNITKAKQLLAQAGVKTPLNVTLTTLAGNTEQEQIATLLQAGLKQIGINLTIAPLTTTAFTNAQYAFKVQAALQEDGPAVFSAPFYLGYTMKCSDPSLGPNLIKMCIPEADRLIDQANAEQNPATRQQLYNQITQIWRVNWSWIPLYSEEDVTVMRKGICGYVHYPHYLDLRGIGAC